MARHQGIYCPTCGVFLPVGEKYHFDSDLSLICDQCDKPITPTTVLSENKIVGLTQDRKFRAITPVLPKQTISYHNDGAY